MRTLHDPRSRTEFQARLAALRIDSGRRWGKMSVDQMLWHVNSALSVALGLITLPAEKPPIPPALLKYLVLYLPWPRGGPTLPAFVAKQAYNFQSERQRCLQLLEIFANKKIDEPWPTNPVFGGVSGRFVTRLQAKHLDHHLRQFGV